MDTTFRFYSWFLVNWSRAGIVCAAVLLALTPALFLVFLQLPIYMLHQYEEHAKGAFKAYVNHEIGKGRELLTDRAILWINIIGVWAVDLAVLYLAAYVRPALGLIAIYVTLINGIIHIAGAVFTRRYNPGLWTSLVLFVPASIAILIATSRLMTLTWGDHLIGIAGGIVLHLFVGLAMLIDQKTASVKVAV